MTKNEDSPLSKAHEAIGAYFCAFASLERELWQTIKVVYRLQNHEAADAIVAALGDFSRKGSLVRAAVQLAKRADGTDTSDEWKESADATLGAILGCSDERNRLAHGELEPHEDGSVLIRRLKPDKGKLKGFDPVLWSQESFTSKIAALGKLTHELASVKDELAKVEIPYQSLAWLNVDQSGIVYRRTMSPALIAAAQAEVPRPETD